MPRPLQRLAAALRLCPLVALPLLSMHSPDARADLATNISYVFDTHLFFVDGDSLVRTHCAPDTVLYDRSLCSEDRRVAPLGEVLRAAEAEVAAEVPALESRLRQYMVRLDQIDRRLLELMSVEPEPERPELLAQRAAREEERVAIDARIAEIGDQIARVEAQLAQAEDADLRALLAELRVSQREAQVAAEDLSAEIARLLDEYVRANARVFDPRTYEDLLRRRAEIVTLVGDTRRQLGWQIDKIVAFARTEKDILDQGFTTERFSSSTGGDIQDGIRALSRRFAGIEAARRTYPAVAGDRRLSIDVRGGERLERLNCQVRWTPEARCFNIRVRSPSGFAAGLDGASFDIRAADHYASVAAMLPLLDEAVQGVWVIEPGCPDLPPAPAALVQSFECALIVLPG
jgi:hypothetical protein